MARSPAALKDYQARRDFARTPEPSGKAARNTGVQWHIIEEESPEPERNVPAGLAYLKSLAKGPK